MQMRSREAALLPAPQADNPPRDQRNQKQQNNQVDIQKPDNRVRVIPERRRLGQRRIGRDPAGNRRDNQQVSQLAPPFAC
jgi:hypothetical protein